MFKKANFTEEEILELKKKYGEEKVNDALNLVNGRLPNILKNIENEQLVVSEKNED